MVTTIQLNENVKKLLDKMKVGRETYEDVIVGLIDKINSDKKSSEELLIEGCKEMYEDMSEMTKDWEGTLMDGLDKNEKWSEFQEEK